MGKRAPRTATTVSLFPFLAVLICAMGALILLLLVTTRRIRHQQIHQTATAVAEPVEAVDPFPQDLPDAEALPPLPLPNRSPFLDAPLTPLFALEPIPALPDPNDPWRDELRALEAEHTQLVAAIADQESAIERIRTALAADTDELQQLRGEAVVLNHQMQMLQQDLQRLEGQRAVADERAAFLRRKIDETREQIATADSRFTILPYDGRLGTTRRPIIIECTEDAITFVSEGVTITASDLNGFTPQHNPLVTTCRALSKYWARKDRQDSDTAASTEGDPYVLLVVRPQGIVAYYAARHLLGSSLDAFGYELVCEDQQFVWPESDPMAKRICRTIVDRMLIERDALYGVRPGRLPGQTQTFSDAKGSFRLDEVDQIRQPEQGVMINGKRYSREPFDVALQETPSDQRDGGPLWDERQAVQPDVPHRGSLSPDMDADGADRFDPPGVDSQLARSEPRLLRPPATDHLAPPDWLHPNRPPALPRSSAEAFGEVSRRQRDATSTLLGDAGDATDATGNLSFSEITGKPLSRHESSDTGSSSNAVLDLAPHSNRDIPPGVNGENPLWGVRRPGGSIGFEREVLVRVTASQVIIADDSSFPIEPGISRNELRNLFALHLNRLVRSWGEPPRSFYWLPSISFMVSPGGDQHYLRLKSITENWKLRSTVKHVQE